MSDSDMSGSEELLQTLRNFCDAYPESVFPTPPEDKRAKDSAVADVMREMALPWFKRAADRIEELERWKAEALTVLAEWENVWEMAGKPGPLGSSKALSTMHEIERLRAVTSDEESLTNALRALATKERYDEPE